MVSVTRSSSVYDSSLYVAYIGKSFIFVKGRRETIMLCEEKLPDSQRDRIQRFTRDTAMMFAQPSRPIQKSK